MCTFHLYLLFTGQTTYEFLKGTFKNPVGNPYYKSNCWENFMWFLNLPTAPEHFNLREKNTDNSTIQQSHSREAMLNSPRESNDPVCTAEAKAFNLSGNNNRA